MIESNKPYTFAIYGYEAILLNGNIEISVSDVDVATKIVTKLTYSLLNNKIRSLRINTPDKIFFIKGIDSSHLHFRCKDAIMGLN